MEAGAWFNPNLYAWIPGTVLGCLGGIFGAMFGFLAPRGRACALVIGMQVAFIVVSLALLVVGIAALVAGQPYGIWYGFSLPGLIGTIVFTVLLPVVRRRYVAAEMRKSQAADL
jgi:hypothetical protein